MRWRRLSRQRGSHHERAPSTRLDRRARSAAHAIRASHRRVPERERGRRVRRHRRTAALRPRAGSRARASRAPAGRDRAAWHHARRLRDPRRRLVGQARVDRAAGGADRRARAHPAEPDARADLDRGGSRCGTAVGRSAAGGLQRRGLHRIPEAAAARVSGPPMPPRLDASPPARRHAWVLALVVLVSAVAWAGPTTVTPRVTATRGATEEGIRWIKLKPSQREALKPLEKDWATIDAPRKQKWL